MEYNPFLFLFHCKQVCLLHLLHFGGRSKSEYSVVVAAFFSSLKHLPRYHWRNNCALGQVSIILTRWFHGIWKYAFFLPWAVNFDPFHIVQVRLLYLPPQKKNNKKIKNNNNNNNNNFCWLISLHMVFYWVILFEMWVTHRSSGMPMTKTCFPILEYATWTSFLSSTRVELLQENNTSDTAHIPNTCVHVSLVLFWKHGTLKHLKSKTFESQWWPFLKILCLAFSVFSSQFDSQNIYKNLL